MLAKKVIIWIDGASQGNPGPAAIGAVIRNERGKLHSLLSECIGETTNNRAEYMALITALKKALSLGARYAEVKSDSELLVRQINGKYRVKKAELKPLYEQVKHLQGFLRGFTITHIPRTQNTEADALANKALRAGKRREEPEKL